MRLKCCFWIGLPSSTLSHDPVPSAIWIPAFDWESVSLLNSIYSWSKETDLKTSREVLTSSRVGDRTKFDLLLVPFVQFITIWESPKNWNFWIPCWAANFKRIFKALSSAWLLDPCPKPALKLIRWVSLKWIMPPGSTLFGVSWLAQSKYSQAPDLSIWGWVCCLGTEILDADLKLEKILLAWVAYWIRGITLSSNILSFHSNHIPQEIIKGRPFNFLKAGFWFHNLRHSSTEVPFQLSFLRLKESISLHTSLE